MTYLIYCYLNMGIISLDIQYQKPRLSYLNRNVHANGFCMCYSSTEQKGQT